MYYFAYGSNMSTLRLKQRTASARPVARARLPGHRLAFHKFSKVDLSGKCDIPQSDDPEHYVIGVVFEIDPREKTLLDSIEGLGKGYEIKEVTVIGENNNRYRAFAYYATKIDSRLKPYHWYKEHVLRGAREHGFPIDYIDWLEEIESINDPDPDRSIAQLGIYTPVR